MVTAMVAVIPADIFSFFYSRGNIVCHFTYPGRSPFIALTVPIVSPVRPAASSRRLMAFTILGMPPVTFGALVAVGVLWAVLWAV